MADNPTNPTHRPVRSFVRRGGRLGSGQKRALVEHGPHFIVPYRQCRVELVQTFGRDAPTVLEIGFGMGHATADIAAAQPQTNFLGIEVHESGVGSLLKLIGERKLANVRIVWHDAVEVVEHMLAPASLAGVHVYFPDPWPKKRHHKRRLIQPPFVSLLASRLQPGGHLHCATDWEPYAHQMLAALDSEPALVNSAIGYAARPSWRPLTKFEGRGLELGHAVHDLLFYRR